MSERIMFVDDDPRILAGLRRALSTQGRDWEMEFVTDPERAEESMKTRPFDVMVVDVRMPGKSGLDLLREVKASVATRDTEVIVLTGLEGGDLKKKALELGAYDFLNKPVVREEMIARLQGALRIKAYRAELEKKHALLEKQLIESQKMEVVGLLAAGVAHDLNNILAVIVGYAELATRTLSCETDKDIVKMIRKIGDVSTRAGRITQQILKVSRQTAASAEWCSIGAIIQECLETLKIVIPPGIRVEFDSESGDGHVEADSAQMYQVFMNLFINGIQAMGDEGVLSVSLGEGEYGLPDHGAVSPFAPGRYVHVEVSDTGSGMSEETKQRIFDPLFTTKESRGSGLGLSVTRKILLNHGGSVTVESTPGKGSTFSVYMPGSRGRGKPANEPGEVIASGT
ncbi:MAG TPA: response regulator [Syntrophorhabdales bacterium]|nr:response regulator [Syntrophorhabdales bacterium]